ncbi:MAG: 1,4-dihydroxy-6-naphthoate synthase, partial [Proteobacteria bacterium]|nr:1,4-dihydroxy-6-naphthoate synthase [Pseudomonadota bacterium]
KNDKKLTSGKIALPGKYTTAALLFKMAFQGDFEFQYIPFDRIIESVREGRSDAGVIIHESRFTFQDSGLRCLLDLGDWWEKETGCLIPLGGIMISTETTSETKKEIGRLICESIRYAELNPGAAREFIHQNSQEMEEDVVNSHIGLYVNEHSKNFGPAGHESIKTFYHKGYKLGLLPEINADIESFMVA